ncbi:MAG: phosphatidylserine decarboxylase family protein [bacterium]
MIVKEGWPFVIGFSIMGLLFLMVTPKTGLWSCVLGMLLLVLGCFCLFFFRDPQRIIQADERNILSPADGTVLEIVSDNSSAGKRTMVKIFLSIFNVHIQRAPAAGCVGQIIYSKGRFLPAMRKEASDENEKNTIILTHPKGIIEVSQIAGIIARRIVCRVKQGETLKAGQQYGLICFGSQVDILLPESVNLSVSPGQKLTAGKTVIGDWK